MAKRQSRRATVTHRRLSYERLEGRQLLAVTTLTSVADTFTAAGINAGTAQVLDALDANGPGDRAVYLRFDLSGIDLANIVSATLTLQKTAGSRNDTIVADRFDVYGLVNAPGLTPQNWNEATLAEGNVGTEYTNTSGNGLDTSQLFNLNQESGANVTEVVNNSISPQQLTGPDLLAFLNARKSDGGLATFITYVDAGANRGWGYGSKENTNPNMRPTLALDDGGPVDPPIDPYPENPIVLPRQMEHLNRGIVAVRGTSASVYVGWRLLGNDPSDIGFNLYRSAGGSAAVKLNSAPLTPTTDFVDTTANLTVSNEYFVRPVIGGVEQAASESWLLAASAPVQQYLNVPIQPPPGGTVAVPAGTQTPPSGTLAYTYNANDASVGDLDGDGQYEIILKWDPSNSQDNSLEGLTGPAIFDAYRLDGTLLWRINLGRNVRAGAHYSPFLVYDFDGDGRSELVMKTADGTVDGLGNVIGNPNADYRDGYTGDSRWGRVLTGPEFLTVFDGLTGAALSTIAFPLQRGSVSSWGDSYGNRVDRFLAGVAYLDGVRPSIVMARGYYDKTMLAAYDWRDGQLTQRWLFDSTAPGNGVYEGQGNHNLSVADVDGDGKDEIIYGAMSIDDDGRGLYSTGLGHGDALHVSDFDPTNPGVEVYQVHEDPSAFGAAGGEFRDAMTGELIFGIPATDDVGRGAAGDIWAGSPGAEMWASGGGATNALFGSAGNNIGRRPSTANFLAWWDADPVRELLDGQSSGNGEPRIDKYGLSSDTRLLTMTDTRTSNGTKATPNLSADILGDWREEVIVRAIDNMSLRIYTTITPSTMRLRTLMHDSQYREAVAWQNSGYNQPPHPSFFLGAGMTTPPAPKIFFGGELKGDYNTDGIVDASDYIVWRRNVGNTSDLRADGDHDGIVGNGDYTVWRSNFGAVAAPEFAAATVFGMRTISPPLANSSTPLNVISTPTTSGSKNSQNVQIELSIFSNSDRKLLSTNVTRCTYVGAHTPPTATSSRSRSDLLLAIPVKDLCGDSSSSLALDQAITDNYGRPSRGPTTYVDSSSADVNDFQHALCVMFRSCDGADSPMASN